MNDNKKQRCQYELCVEKYFGLSSPLNELERITVDYGKLCDLLCAFHQSLTPSATLKQLSDCWDAAYKNGFEDAVTLPQGKENPFPDKQSYLASIPAVSIGGGDMTAREYFCGEGSPLTLDKICTLEEREFLLQHIELYAKGKVYQATKT